MARVATNVRLDAAQLHQLKRLAVERGVSLSALFRVLIADYLVRVSTLTGRDWRADPFFQVGRAAWPVAALTRRRGARPPSLSRAALNP